MNKIKLILTIVFIVGLSIAGFVHAADLTDAEQNKIRKQLYVMDDFSGLTNEQIAQYRKIIYQHMVKLEDKIEDGNGLLSWNAAKGSVLAGLAIFQGYCVYRIIEGWQSVHRSYWEGIKNFVDLKHGLNDRLKTGIFLCVIKLAYDYLRKAYNTKDRARSRLLRDKGVLYQLEKATKSS